MIVALCLAAVDCHLSGRHRWAFWIWFLGSLGRPEVWPFWLLAGLYLWRTEPGTGAGCTRRSGRSCSCGSSSPASPRRASSPPATSLRTALRDPRQQDHRLAEAVSRAEREHGLGARRADLDLGGVAQAARDSGARRGALLWFLIEIAEALKGFPAVPRYLFEPGAIVCILGAVAIGRLIIEVPPLISRGLERLSPGRIGTRWRRGSAPGARRSSWC